MLSALDMEYSPSQWSRRFGGIAADVLQNHVDVCRSHSAQLRARLPPETFSYGPAAADQLDLYCDADASDTAPICAFIHGGYWQAGSRQDYAFVATHLCAAGYRVFIVGYELCPAVAVDDIVGRIVRAGRFIGDYAQRLGAKHISYVGHSAGAHLIACMVYSLLATSPAYLDSIRHLFLVSGVYDLVDLSRAAAVNPANILGLHDRRTVDALSPVRHRNWSLLAERGAMQVHVLVAEHDSATFRLQSQAFADVLLRHGVRCDVAIVDGCDHFDIVENLLDGEFQLTVAIIATVHTHIS